MSAWSTGGRVVGGLAGVGVAGVAYAALVERRLFALREFAVPVLAPGSSPVRILQLSDLHLVAGQQRKIAWVRGLASLAPDLVVNSGDNLSDPRGVPGVLEAMEPLQEFPGLFVMGSNDYWAPKAKNPALYLTRNHKRHVGTTDRLPTDELIDGLARTGWRQLDNQRTSMAVSGVPLEFVGLGDPHVDFDRPGEVEGPGASDVAATIGLVHAPYQRALDALVGDGASLVLAGHTHGGQLAVPGYGALVTNCDLDRSRAKGLSRWWAGAANQPSTAAPTGAAYLHVSAGLGESRYAPVRFACRPEATLLTLLPRELEPPQTPRPATPTT